MGVAWTRAAPITTEEPGMRTCPNWQCRRSHEDDVKQCPDCGANMNRTPDAPRDPNMELFAMRDRAMRELASERTRSLGSPRDLVDVALDVMDDPTRTSPLSIEDRLRYGV